MKLKAFEAHYSCGHFKPNNIKNGSVVKKLSWKNLGVSIKLFYTVYMDTSSTSRGYPRLRILRKIARKSTDLEEYIFLEPKNFFQLQKFKKLRRAPFGEKVERFFFYRNMLVLNMRFARFDYTRDIWFYKK